MKDIDESIMDLKRELRDLDEDSYIEKMVLYMAGPGKYSLEPEYSALAMMRKAHGQDSELENVDFYPISNDLYIGYKADLCLESEEEKTIIGPLFIARLDYDGYTEELTAMDHVNAMRFIESHMIMIISEDKLMIQLIPTAENREMLRNIPSRQVHDLSIVYRFMLSESTLGSASILVNDDMLSRFGIDETKLYQDAIRNSVEKFPAKLSRMGDMLGDLMGIDIPEDENPGGLFVATCNGGYLGASVMMYPDFMKEASDKLHDNFYTEMYIQISRLYLLQYPSLVRSVELRTGVGTDLNHM